LEGHTNRSLQMKGLVHWLDVGAIPGTRYDHQTDSLAEPTGIPGAEFVMPTMS
jgi:hypothetical protein